MDSVERHVPVRTVYKYFGTVNGLGLYEYTRLKLANQKDQQQNRRNEN